MTRNQRLLKLGERFQVSVEPEDNDDDVVRFWLVQWSRVSGTHWMHGAGSVDECLAYQTQEEDPAWQPVAIYDVEDGTECTAFEQKWTMAAQWEPSPLFREHVPIDDAAVQLAAAIETYLGAGGSAADPDFCQDLERIRQALATEGPA